MVYASDAKCRYVRVVDGHPLTEKHQELTTKFPTRVMFWSCFSWNGTGRMHVIEGNMDSIYYIDPILERRVLQQMNEWYADGSGIFQHDNAPSHISKWTKAFLETNLNDMTWPAQSPDIKPIENLWGIVKQRLRDGKVFTGSEIASSFIKVWKRDEEIQAMCKYLVESMPRRVAAVIDNRGGHTEY